MMSLDRGGRTGEEQGDVASSSRAGATWTHVQQGVAQPCRSLNESMAPSNEHPDQSASATLIGSGRSRCGRTCGGAAEVSRWPT